MTHQAFQTSAPAWQTSSLAPASYDEARRRPFGVGVVVSLLIHAALLMAAWRAKQPVRVDAGAHVISVWLQAPAPRVLPPRALAPAPVAPATPAPSRRTNTPRNGPSQPQELIALPAQAVPAPPSDFKVEQAPAAAPRFDPDAARKTARALATKADPERAATAVGQLDTHPLYPEEEGTRLAREMAKAKRANCLNDKNAGLLTPLGWLFDKKDSGCKL
ncbi:MAG: hypothetical protein V4582_09205 [Pseudomonadota bacterium]